MHLYTHCPYPFYDLQRSLFRLPPEPEGLHPELARAYRAIVYLAGGARALIERRQGTLILDCWPFLGTDLSRGLDYARGSTGLAIVSEVWKRWRNGSSVICGDQRWSSHLEAAVGLASEAISQRCFLDENFAIPDPVVLVVDAREDLQRMNRHVRKDGLLLPFRPEVEEAAVSHGGWPTGDEALTILAAARPHIKCLEKLFDLPAVVDAGLPAMKSDELAILQVLADCFPVTIHQYDLVARLEERGVYISRGTIGPHLEGLRDLGLVHRARGERGGDAITDLGLKLIHNYLRTD